VHLNQIPLYPRKLDAKRRRQFIRENSLIEPAAALSVRMGEKNGGDFWQN